MDTNFNELISSEIKKLSKAHLVSEEQLEGKIVCMIEGLFIQLETVMDGIDMCISNPKYLKALKKLNHKYSIYH